MDINGARMDQSAREGFRANVKFVENKKYFDDYELVEDNMTVKELIEKLQEMPQDLLVVDWGGYHVDGCHINEEYYDGDSANPKCPILTVVVID